MSQIDRILDLHKDRLQSLEDGIIGEVIGVAQAIDELRKSLDQLSMLLNERKFGKASDLGYREIASNFVFLQRTLAGLQSVDQDVSSCISDMAGDLECSYEDIEADVKSKIFCYRTRAEIAEDEAAEWKRENAEAIENVNRWVEESGLPLSKHQPE
ncbi:hypothetical protein RKLH11_4094 [Rhodobacteraceae bacterium KLH11]|nr:hypothetical protein RKLH11_4094 [Rhodobacteraceae bacterium KLH11]